MILVVEQMQVVISGSRNLYPYFPVLYESLFAHDKDVTLWIMAEDDKLPYEVPDNVRVVNVSGQTIFRKDGPNSRSPFTYLAMIRAAYPLLFNGGSYGGVPKLPKLDRVISLDCDIVCCDTLKPIWDMDLTDKWLAAVAEYPDDSRPLGRTNKYANCGVTVMNLEQMRQDKVSEKAIDLLNRKSYTFVDEQVLNILNIADGDRRIADLPPRYNEIMTTCLSLKPAIVHYAGIKCIWQKNLDEEYRGHYLKAWMPFAKEKECATAGIKF